MSEDIMELKENAQHGSEERSLAPVTMTMAILAVLIAGASLLGHRAHTEELLLQTRATDQWAYYQAKKIREYESEVAVTLLHTLGTDSAKTEAPLQKLEAACAKYFASEAALENATEGLRIHGAYGYSKEYDIERLYRDAPLTCIGEGTNEMQRMIIAKQWIKRNKVA